VQSGDQCLLRTGRVVVIDNRVLQGPGSGEAAIYVWKRRLVSDWRGRYQMDLMFTGRLNLDLFFCLSFLFFYVLPVIPLRPVRAWRRRADRGW